MKKTFELDSMESMSALSDIYRILRNTENVNSALRKRNGELITQYERSVDHRKDLVKKIDELEAAISANEETPTTDPSSESDPEALFQDAQKHIMLALERIDSLSEYNVEYGFRMELALAKMKLDEADLWLSGKAKDKYKVCAYTQTKVDKERN